MWYKADIKNKQRTYAQYIISFLFIFVTMLGVGTIMHYFFNVKSAFSRYLGFND